MAQTDTIRIRGARTHNLKNVDIDIPKNRLVVITGLSGSGKSSLAFDTLYAEGQRRYAESLSAYARRFMDVLDRPDVDSVEGLTPSIAIGQHSGLASARSNVATATEIADYLRLLFSRAGTPFCPEHQVPLAKSSIHAMVDAALKCPEGARVMVLAPLGRRPRQAVMPLAREMARKGFVRVLLDTDIYLIEELPEGLLKDEYEFSVVVDRLKVAQDARNRLAESFETATGLTEGKAALYEMETGRMRDFSLRYGCPVCCYTMPEITAPMFSFNNALGACPHCEGAGLLEQFSPNLLVKSGKLSLAEGALCGYGPENLSHYKTLRDFSALEGFSLTDPWEILPDAVKTYLLYGSDAAKAQGMAVKGSFSGLIPTLDSKWKNARSEGTKIGMRVLRRVTACPVCGGDRFRKEVRQVFLGESNGKINLVELMNLSLSKASERLRDVVFSEINGTVAKGLIEEIQKRLGFLIDVGLGYLTLSRPTNTLSGGEIQRIRLACQIGSGLSGVTYVLDEPTIGLHPKDTEKLVLSLRKLVDIGNTVVVVEHDASVMQQADYIIDMGPGAGELGGTVVAAGTPKEIQKVRASRTGAYLAGMTGVAVPGSTFNPTGCRVLKLVGASGHNLKGLTCSFPAGALTVVTGVSGSGKSTLVNDTLGAALRGIYMRAKTDPLPYKRIEGKEYFDKIITIDQSPIGKTPRSNPATYIGLFTLIRDVFAETQSAKERGYGTGRFSFNSPGGRCEACEGDGQIKIEMGFLPPVYVTCTTCQGKRYNRETLEVKYKGKSISDVLEMTVDEAQELFSVYPQINRKLQTLQEVGLGYIRLGQSATTFSGGEAQRIKLADELSQVETGKTLYILDEPTTGLHFDDVSYLIRVLRSLTDRGNSVIVIEHDMDVIGTADWIVDVGPGGGSDGGTLVCEGTPESVAGHPGSQTGECILRWLLQHKKEETLIRKRGARRNLSQTARNAGQDTP